MKESIFDKLNEDILEGIEGKNEGIPIGLPKLGKYGNIRKNILTLIFSTTGAGKSAMIDTIILNACDDHINYPNKLKPDFQLFSMERASKIRIAKWLCFIIFVKEGVEIQLPKMLGWWEDKLSSYEYNLILKYKNYVDLLLNDYITIHEGAKTPNEVFKIMKDHFENKGEYDVKITIDPKTGKERKRKIYIPNNPREIVIPIFDHGNLIKTTQALPSKKSAIDKLVEMVQEMRDLESCAPIWVSQVNRAISGVTRSKDTEQELMMDDVKESGDIVDAADLVISLFDPLKYKQSSKTGYEPVDFVDKTNGNNYFRSAQILKSSYGADSVRVPLAFNGFCGQFMELPKRIDLSEKEYKEMIENILSKKFFIKN
jgi:hypothetical protein